MAVYKYDVDTCVSQGNSTVTTSLSFATVEQALASFNDSIETRRSSHVAGQFWEVTLYDMDIYDIMARISSTDFNLK